MKTVGIRVETEDLKRARTQGKQRLVEDNPNMEGMVISDRLMYKRMVKYFIED